MACDEATSWRAQLRDKLEPENVRLSEPARGFRDINPIPRTSAASRRPR